MKKFISNISILLLIRFFFLKKITLISSHIKTKTQHLKKIHEITIVLYTLNSALQTNQHPILTASNLIEHVILLKTMPKVNQKLGFHLEREVKQLHTL